MIVFEYVIEGSRFVSSQIFTGSDGRYWSIDFAQDLVRRYPKGSRVDVHFDAANPVDALLEPNYAEVGWLFCILGTVFLAVGGLLVFCTWLAKIISLSDAMGGAV